MTSQKDESTKKELVYQISQSLNEDHWFLEERLNAYSLLSELKVPKIERLDYSAWNLFEEFTWVKEKEDFSNNQPIDKESTVDFIQKSSGSFRRTTKLDEQVLVTNFNGLEEKEKELFKQMYKNSAFLNQKDAFSAFTLAFLTSGIFVYIPKGTAVKEPINLAFIEDELDGQTKNHQVFIYAAENSSIEIIENYYSVGEKKDSTKLNVHVDIQVGTGAIVKYTAIDELAEETTAFFRRTARTDRDATLELALGIMSGGNIIEDVHVDLMGDGSSADVKSVAISRSQQVQGVNTNITNHGAHTIGNIYQHGVVLDQATLTFNGIGDVLKNAKNSDAQQESRILILSEEARADTNPLLLIDEYELTAGHAASISRVDEAQLYYLMSRGLGRKQAEKLVIRGFLGSVLTAISVKEVREEFIQTIERKLNAL